MSFPWKLTPITNGGCGHPNAGHRTAIVAFFSEESIICLSEDISSAENFHALKLQDPPLLVIFSPTEGSILIPFSSLEMYC